MSQVMSQVITACFNLVRPARSLTLLWKESMFTQNENTKYKMNFVRCCNWFQSQIQCCSASICLSEWLSHFASSLVIGSIFVSASLSLYWCFLLYFRWLLYFYLLCLFIHLCLYLKGQHSESLTLNGGLGATFKTWLRCFTPLCWTLLHCMCTVHQAVQGHPHLHCLQSYHRSYLAHIGTSSTLPPSCHWFLLYRTIWHYDKALMFTSAPILCCHHKPEGFQAQWETES